MKRTIMVVVLGCALAACGGSSSPAPAASAPTATAPIATTTEVSVPFANVATTTSVAMSRDARLAVERCRKALGQFFASQVGPLGGGHAQIKETETLCDEAELQLKADNPSSGSVSGQLVAEIARLKVVTGVRRPQGVVRQVRHDR